MASLSIGIVTYFPDPRLLETCIRSLSRACRFAIDKGSTDRITVHLVDNTTEKSSFSGLEKILEEITEIIPVDTKATHTSHNIGFGKAHNIAIQQSSADYHLVLNPDVIVTDDVLYEAMTYLGKHQDIGILTPKAYNASGEQEYLSKRYPTVTDLALRGFAPVWLKNVFHARLEHYEMRDVTGETPVKGIPIVSGCFMFARRELLQKIGGFSQDYFLYFEDFDLSMRSHPYLDIAYVPAVRIIHYGGNSARKGLHHIVMFLKSAFIFFSTHGWKLW